MILRYDRLGVEIPAGDPDPSGARVVQELMGGRFGEMSTLMNYTFQSFNFRNKAQLRPFYDLIANIAAEEYGHIELVAMTINSMLTGTDGTVVFVDFGASRPPALMSYCETVPSAPFTTYHILLGFSGLATPRWPQCLDLWEGET